MFALIPSLFFLLGYAAMEGMRDGELARKQSEANRISVEMNMLSANVSRAIQGVSIGNTSYEEVQERLDDANGRLAAMQRDLEIIWSDMDELKVKAADDEALARILRLVGMALSIMAFGIIGSRDTRVAPQCLVAIALLLGLTAV